MVDAVAAFRDHLRSEKRASAHTLRAYLRDVGELGAFARQLCGRAPTLRDLDPIVCRSYLASLHGRNDAVTIGRKLSSLRAFFRFLVRRRLVSSSPVAALRAPKRSKRLPAFLGKDDVGRLLDGPARAEDPELAATRARDEALFEIIYAAGLRVSEACYLDLDDLTTSGVSGEVKVRQGKGRKDRIVPVGRKAIAAVAAYLVHRTAWMASSSSPPMERLEPLPHAVTCRGHRRNDLRVPTRAILTITGSLALWGVVGCGERTGGFGPPGDAVAPDIATSDGGTSPAADGDAVILPASVGCAKQLASGDDYACILYDDGRAACLGGGGFGQLGTGATADATAPLRVEQLPAARFLAAGGHHSCAYTTTDGLLCWGDNRSSELGVSGLEQSALPVPVHVPGASQPVQLALGSRHGCLLDRLVHGYCWGTGALGMTLPVVRQIPAIGEAPFEILQLGGSATRVIDAGHLVDVPWRTDGHAVSPIPGAPDRVIANAIGDDHECLLKSGGTVWCRGTGYPSFYAVVADFGDDVAEVAVGTDFTCARTAEGQVLCRGRNDSGQLGDGTLAARGIAVTVPLIAPAVELSLGSVHACARLVDGSVWCWGALGGSAIREAPERVAGPGPAETCRDVTSSAPVWGRLPIPDASAAEQLSDATTAWAQNQCRCGIADDAGLPGCIRDETPLLQGCLAALGAGSEAQALCIARAEWSWAACAVTCAGQASVSGLAECVPSAGVDCGARSGALAFCLRRSLPCDQSLAVQAQYFQTCDGKMDCPNGFDEANCSPNSTAFHCADGSSSIAIDLVMNGSPDCPDGSDEL